MGTLHKNVSKSQSCFQLHQLTKNTLAKRGLIKAYVVISPACSSKWMVHSA